MDILRFLFYAFLFYIAFRLVFDFILPVYRTTKRIRKGFREMQDQINQHSAPYPQQGNYVAPGQNPGTHKGASDDYIDFEEVKD